MKLLTRDETQGLDSTSKTIKKWDDFFKKAIPNLGYRDELLDKMYPYSKGIPKIDGTYLPVSEVTGRVFFKMSWADKFAQVLSCFTGGSSTPPLLLIEAFMASFWAAQESNFRAFFKDEADDAYADYKKEYDDNINIYGHLGYITQTKNKIELFNKYWAQFIENSNIYTCNLHNSSRTYDDAGEISEEHKKEIKERTTNKLNPYAPGDSGLSPIIYCHLIEDVFDKIDQSAMYDMIRRITSSNATSRFSSFGEVYLQDYLVLSLNPIDKFMCSTKQAFSSCMSIAKQNETRGTSSTPAFGLPALFPSDSVFMLFLTPGKHKNMYWESAEWQKDPASRDPEKAYKYLKMTCRALTYKGLPSKEVYDYINETKKRVIQRTDKSDIKCLNDFRQALEDFDTDTERLYVGRQYSANGEDYIWQEVIEYLLAIHGISTSMAYANQVDKMYHTRAKVYNEDASWINSITPSNFTADISEFNRIKYLRRGEMHDDRVAAIDRYGYVRGIYYDNLGLSFLTSVANCKHNTDGKAFVPTKEIMKLEYPLSKTQQINVGTTRYGTCGVTWFPPASSLDMFKMMSGEQLYTTLNTYVKVCPHCKKLIIDATSLEYHGELICKDCAKDLDLVECSCCGTVYSNKDKEEREQHTQYNIMELLNPKNYKDMPPKMVCGLQLEVTSTGDGYTAAICAHCGDILASPLGKKMLNANVSQKKKYGPLVASTTFVANFKGFDVNVQVCENCLRKAVMCDKCHRLIFLESISDACLLLPNRRVICPDCVDAIRMQKHKRAKYTEVLDMLKYTPDKVSKDTKVSELEQATAELAEEKNLFDLYSRPTLIKDVKKQIKSYKQAHPEEGMPTLKSSNLAFPGEEMPVAVSEER